MSKVMNAARAVMCGIILCAQMGSVVLSEPVEPEPQAATSTFDAAAVCPPTWEWPPLVGTAPEWLDYNLAILAEGDFVVTGGAAESEGRVWVGGRTLIDRSPPALFNLGRVGRGSQVAPPSGAVMLMTGRNDEGLTLTPGNRLDVGHGVNMGGDIRVAGKFIADEGAVETNGGNIIYDLGPEATARYSQRPADLRALSQNLGGLSANGTVTRRIWPDRLEFTGTGTAGELQVFEVDASDLGPGSVEKHFWNIPDETPVVINVRGEGVTLESSAVMDNGIPADDPTFDSRPGIAAGHPQLGLFAKVAVRTMWNFVDAKNLDIAGTSQNMGSILAMEAEKTVISSSVNGRIYVGGDLVLNGTGNETHNYHWPYGELTACSDDQQVSIPAPETGEVRVKKELAPGSEDFANWEFHGQVQCLDPEPGYGPNAPDVLHPFTLRPGEEETMKGLPLERMCSVIEYTSIDPPSGADPPIDVSWLSPQFDPDGGQVQVRPYGESTITITITNTATAPFSVSKEVEGPETRPDEGYTGDREFAVSYSCEFEGRPENGFRDGERVEDSAQGTLRIRAGQSATSLDFRMGTECTLTEDLEPGGSSEDFTGDYSWTDAQFIPGETITVGAASPARTVRLVNRYSALGSFQVQKKLSELAAGKTLPETTFSIGYVCTKEGAPSPGFAPDNPSEIIAPDGTGTLTVSSNATKSSPLFVAGTTCTLNESFDSGPDPAPGHLWATPQYFPENTVTIVAGADTTIAVHNSLLAPAWTVEKSADPKNGSEVHPGSVITYTLVAKNTGQVPLEGLQAIDSLIDVLEHAELDLPLNEGLEFDQVAGTLTWEIGALQPGEETSVSYSVTVNHDAWNSTLRNLVTAESVDPEGGIPSAQCPDSEGDDGCSTTHTTPPPPSRPGLPGLGGVGTSAFLVVGMLLLAMSAFFSFSRRFLAKNER